MQKYKTFNRGLIENEQSQVVEYQNVVQLKSNSNELKPASEEHFHDARVFNSTTKFEKTSDF